MRSAAVTWCTEIPGLQVYLFRRISEDLVKNHIEGKNGLRSMLAPWVQAKFVEIVESEIRFWNGSKIYLCHCKDEKDRFKYLGAEIHVLLLDELTTFTEVIYRFLRSRCRAPGLKVPEKYKGMFPRILAGSNPGGIGHHFVKAAFIDGAQPYDIRQQPDEEGGMLRQFIPARLDDNLTMAEDDPGYRGKLSGLGSPAMVKAMLDGDWNVVVGAFFTEFSTARHVVAPIELPRHWLRYRAMDWGSAKPFAVGWFAVSDGELAQFPRGALVMYREWYGMGQQVNTGLKMTAEQVGAGIADRSRGESYAFSVLDPAAFSHDGGPSLAERIAIAGARFEPADNKRVAQRGAMGGWDQVRARLVGEDERPMLYIFSTCVHTIRTLPALQHDEMKPEDVDTDSEDHAGDMVRYACMARPYVTGKPPGPEAAKYWHQQTAAELFALDAPAQSNDKRWI